MFCCLAFSADGRRVQSNAKGFSTVSSYSIIPCIRTGEESHSLISFDPQGNKNRSWWFTSEGLHNTSRGAWDAGTKTFSYRTEPKDGKITRSTMRLVTPDQHEWHMIVTDAAGTVIFDSTITTTRRP